MYKTDLSNIQRTCRVYNDARRNENGQTTLRDLFIQLVDDDIMYNSHTNTYTQIRRRQMYAILLQWYRLI